MPEPIQDYQLNDIPVGEIEFGPRVRQDYGEIDLLSASIDSRGLWHPILVLDKDFFEGSQDELDEDKPYLLIAGGRRLTAIKNLGHEKVSAKIFQRMLDEYEVRTIELEENLHRKDLSPVEVAEARSELHELYVRRYGEATGGSKSVGHTLEETAEVLGVDRSTLTKDIKLAKYAKANPEIRQAKSKAEAHKMARQLEKKLAKEEIARRLKEKQKKDGTTAKEKKRKEALLERFVMGDFFEEIQKLQARSVDLFELDPDWGIDFKKSVQDRGSLTADDYRDIAPEAYLDRLEEMLKEAYRVMKDNSWLIVWYSLEQWHKETHDAILDAGFKIQHMPAFWLHSSNRTATPAYRLGQDLEAFFYARKGDPRIIGMGHSQTFRFRKLQTNERTHPAEKPIELYESIMETFLGDKSGAICVTGFAGSGNFILAADNQGYNGLGYDLSETYHTDYLLKVENGEPGTYKSYSVPENG